MADDNRVLQLMARLETAAQGLYEDRSKCKWPTDDNEARELVLATAKLLEPHCSRVAEITAEVARNSTRRAVRLDIRLWTTSSLRCCRPVPCPRRLAALIRSPVRLVALRGFSMPKAKPKNHGAVTSSHQYTWPLPKGISGTGGANYSIRLLQ